MKAIFPMVAPKHPHWDIFCTVVDNYGDIGVTWRLAKQLVNEYQIPIKLWVDDLNSFSHILFNSTVTCLFSTLFMNKVGECYLPSIVQRQYFSIIFNEKSVHYTQ